MPYINDDMLDAGLNHLIARTSAVYFCDQYPATYEQATSTYALGYRNLPVLTGPVAREEGGRSVRLLAFSNGTPVRAGTPSFYALVDGTAQERMVVGDLTEEMAVLVDQPIAIADDIVVSWPNYEDAA
jgi:hypothetical protein